MCHDRRRTNLSFYRQPYMKKKHIMNQVLFSTVITASSAVDKKVVNTNWGILCNVTQIALRTEMHLWRFTTTMKTKLHAWDYMRVPNTKEAVLVPPWMKVANEIYTKRLSSSVSLYTALKFSMFALDVRRCVQLFKIGNNHRSQTYRHGRNECYLWFTYLQCSVCLYYAGAKLPFSSPVLHNGSNLLTPALIVTGTMNFFLNSTFIGLWFITVYK